MRTWSAQELAHEIAALPQGAVRRDTHTIGASAFKAGDLKPNWPNHGL